MGIGYRPSSKDRSTFKKRETGDGGLSQLRQRDQQVLEGMHTLKNQTAEIGNDQIAGIKRVQNIEWQNRQDIKAAVEDKTYEDRRKAIDLNRRREYEAMMQKAKEAGREAALWEKLTPTGSAFFSGIAQDYYEMAENKNIQDAHKTQTPTARLWARVTDEALNAAELDTLVEAHSALNKTKNVGLAQWLSGRSAKLSVGYHDVHARREKANLSSYWTSFSNALQRDGVTIDSTNIEQHVETFRAIMLKTNGWVNTSSQGVLELNEAITRLKTSQTKEHILSETTAEGNRQYKALYDITTSTALNAPNMNSLVQRKMLTLDGDGKLPNMKQAIEAVFVDDLANDLTVPLEQIYAALDFETPEKGRDAKYPTYGTRNALLKEKIRQARADAGDKERKLAEKENKAKDHFEKKKAIQFLSHTGEYGTGGAKEGQGWDGSTKSRTDMADWAKQQGFTETAKLIETYAPFDEKNYTKGLQLKSIEDLVDAGKYEEAMNVIENSPLLTTEDRNNAKLEFLPVLQHFVTAGSSEAEIEETLEGLLLTKVGGTYVGQQGKTNVPSLQGAVDGGKAYIMERFKHHDKYLPDTNEGYAKALELAWGDAKSKIDSNEGFAHITKGLDSDTDISYFTKYQPLVDPGAIKADEDLQVTLKNNPIVRDLETGNITSLGAWETEEIISTGYLHQAAQDLANGLPIEVPGKVIEESIATGVPVDILMNAQLSQKRKYNGQEGSFTQRMRPGPRDIAIQGAYPGYLNVKDRIALAHGRVEVQNLVNFADTGGNNNLDNRDPAVNNATQLSEADLLEIDAAVAKAKERSGKEEIIISPGVRLKWAEVKKVCTECDLNEIDFNHPMVKFNRYKFKPGSKSEKYLLEKIATGELSGLYKNAYTNEIIVEED